MFSDAKSRLLKWSRRKSPVLNVANPQTVEEIADKTSNAMKVLISLRNEHSNMVELLRKSVELSENDESTSKTEQKIEFARNNILALQRGIDEARDFMLFTNVVETLGDRSKQAEAEHRELKDEIKKLKKENDTLRRELTNTTEQLVDVTGKMECLQVELDQMHFLSSLDQLEKTTQKSNIIETSEKTVDLHFIDERDTPPEGSFPSLPTLVEKDYEFNPRLKIFHNLVMNYVAKGLYSVAEPLCKTTLKDMMEKYDSKHPDVIALMDILSNVYRYQHMYNEALEIQLNVLDLKKEVLGEDNIEVVGSLNNLAVLFGKCGKCEDAENYCRQALKCRKRLIGNDHPDVGKQLCNLAVLCTHMLKYEEADVCYREALQIFHNSPVDDIIIHKTKSQLATLYKDMEKTSDAETLYKDILMDAYKKEFGIPTEGAIPQWNLTENNMLTLDNEWEKISTVANPIVASTLLNLYEVYKLLKREGEAKLVLRYAMICMRNLSGDLEQQLDEDILQNTVDIQTMFSMAETIDFSE